MLKQLAQAIGFSSVLLLMNYVDLTSSAGDVRFHWPRPIDRIALANLLDILIVTGVFACLLWALRKTRWWAQWRLLLAAVLPPLLLTRNIPLFPFTVPTWTVVVACVGWIVLLVGFRMKWKAGYAGLTGFCGIVLTGFAAFGLLMSFQLFRSMIWRPGPQQISTANVDAAAFRTRPLLVWVIYDELSYDQVFEHRDPSLTLPNFDRMRAISATYTNVSPVAYKTAQVIPSVLLGKRVTDLNYSWSNQLAVETDDSKWQSFDVRQTLFGAAKRAGRKTSIVGWYFPYCPLFSELVDECYWSNADALDSDMAPDASLAQNTFRPLVLLAKQLVVPRSAERDEVAIEAKAHWATYNDLQQRALTVVKNDTSDLILLHMPVPHPPGMYSRRRHEFSPRGNYLGSLVLADSSLGEILSALQLSPRWSQTTMIVMGDHSWRVGMWRSRPGWTARNQAISHGVFDPRPALLIHKAGQSVPESVSSAFPLLQLHDRIECQITGKQQDCL